MSATLYEFDNADGKVGMFIGPTEDIETLGSGVIKPNHKVMRLQSQVSGNEILLVGEDAPMRMMGIILKGVGIQILESIDG